MAIRCCVILRNWPALLFLDDYFDKAVLMLVQELLKYFVLHLGLCKGPK